MISGLLLLLGTSLAQETGLSASASLNLVRPCERDADCSLTKACVDGGCRDPCSSGSRSVCPMEGGLCKVVGHRPVCSCPPGTHNLNSTCTSDTSCTFGEKRFSNGEVRYDDSCSNRCECYSSQWICQATDCEPGFRQKGLLRTETDPLCQERAHPGGDECCVLWVCAEEAEEEEEGEGGKEGGGPCEHIICGNNAACDQETGRCVCSPGTNGDPDNLKTGCVEKEDNLKLLQITATSIQVQFPDITGGNLMYVESELLSRKDPPWENAILVEGNEIFTLTGLKAGTKYMLRWKAPDRQYPDLEVATGPSRQGQKPKVIMTAHTYNSAQLSFDQFRPSGYTSGYVVSWRKAGQENAAWESAEKEPSGDTPSVTIEGLTPGTQYEAKISIYEDPTNRVLGRSTELIRFSTEPGCVHEGAAHPLGIFFVGCDSACECEETGRVSCSERCTSPLHRRGTCGDSVLCVERPVDESNCCVLVVRQDESPSSPCQDTECGPRAECRHEIRGDGGGEPETICVCQEGYTGDPDSEEGCALATTKDGSPKVGDSPACRAQNTSYSPGETWFDGCEFSCSCSPKLEIACEPRCKLITENVDSQCELKPDPEDPCCKTMVCPPATNNTNILQPSLPFDGCVFKGSTYQKEERFFDGCEQQCQCMGWGDLVCLARCPPTTPGVGEDCYTLPDATDSCCNLTVCDKPTLEVPDVERVPGLVQEKNNELSPLTERAKQPRVIDIPDEVEGVKLGSFVEHHHDVKGELWAVNSTTLVIRNFSYDGQGPDVFFYAGSSDSPRADGATILPYPWKGRFLDEDEDGEVLGAFSNENILLHLPPSLPVSKLRWLSVWCRLFGINFGDVILEEALSVEERIKKSQQTTIESTPTPSAVEEDSLGCLLFGQRKEVGEEWYDGCNAYCVCQESGEAACLQIECPHEFGLDVIQPNCIDWDRHEDFVPVPPQCCPPVPTCKSDGSCNYKGSNFSNYDTIPMELSGCEDRCYCEDTKVLCKDACYKLSENAPSWLQCEDGCAAQLPREDRPCCLEWQCGGPEACKEDVPAPEPLFVPSNLQRVKAAAYNESCIEVTFLVPPSVEGQRGYYTVAYSSPFGGPQNPNNWPEVKFPQEGGTIPDAGALFGEEVTGRALLCQLQPGIDYLLRPKLWVEVAGEFSTSVGDIVIAKIEPTTTQAPQTPVIYIDMKLEALEITATSARMEWRHLDEQEEKPHVDGIQLRRIQLDPNGIPVSHVPETSPFIHRDTNYYVLEELQPDTVYEIDLDLIPVLGALKEFYSAKKVEFRTQPLVDIYNFTPVLSIVNQSITDNSVEVSWQGVPSPDQKFVNIYRVIYHAIGENSIRDESSVFKISKLDSPKRIQVASLVSDQEYQIWLEAYLTNGKTIASNVLTFHTKMVDPSALPTTRDEEGEEQEHSYYSSMVAAAIVATFALMGLAIILYFYLRRHTTYKATITKERPASNASTAYDNSAFKDFETSPASQANSGQTFELGNFPGIDAENNGIASKHNP